MSAGSVAPVASAEIFLISGPCGDKVAVLLITPCCVSKLVQRNLDPDHHSFLPIRSWAWRSCEVKSAEFAFDSMYLHWPGEVRSRICWILLEMKTWKRCALFEMYPSTTLLSAQKTSFTSYILCRFQLSWGWTLSPIVSHDLSPFMIWRANRWEEIEWYGSRNQYTHVTGILLIV